ncbi:dihydroxyacetone kinase subunit DhaL [Mycetocola reblochoni]|uniref:Phosphoenolpyruvate-dihydroxyacetone phosphotransferase, ADP-binding subunit DhaL n=2 Tax=Mycetocola reblochoni TaxID=331618 RepID=A0A1R4J6U4_9MICO|nr:dihydroxyacetone kinase subunit DhaL [Mycetocola reblochoni]RLP69598.1 dihydroxyacetone kinase subunit L [Mycetocola reblochoni]SJN27535.1 Phosphoenolpyruvate-dihydroxyacetone phosphotransferase, ADP-binding subunit DhaL [Mycetocola reblochoni REB411]
MTLDTAWARRWIAEAAATLVGERDRLNGLDRAIGDGDHGENLDRGFQAAADRVSGLADATTPAEVLKVVASALISTVGGAAGPLYGTAFARASRATAGEPEWSAETLATALTAAAEGVAERGKSTRGEKTMNDAWGPAADAASAASGAGESAEKALVAAADAARAGAEATEPLVATKGRASYLGDRSAGHRDPGAESTALLLAAAVTAVS